MKRFVICSGRTVADLQEQIDRKIGYQYIECRDAEKMFDVHPYGDVQFLDGNYVMTFIINKKVKN